MEISIKNFSLKFVDIMLGIVLGLGFDRWALLQHTWQYIAFVFVYLDIVDYWIDYSPSLKKFPPKREIDVFLDVAIMFSVFLYIYATKFAIVYFLAAFIVFRIFDYLWLLSSRREFRPTGTDKLFLDTWINFNLAEIFITLGLIVINHIFTIEPLAVLITFMLFRVIVRIFASLRYKKVHFV